MLLASHKRFCYWVALQLAIMDWPKNSLLCIDWKYLYSVWPGPRALEKKKGKKKSHVSDSKAVLFMATKQVCVSWTRTSLLPRKQKQMACEQSHWKPGRAGDRKPQILPKSRSLGTPRGHAERQLLLGGGANEEGSCGERAGRERQYREACVALELGQTQGPHMHYITPQWKANIGGIRAGALNYEQPI